MSQRDRRWARARAWLDKHALRDRDPQPLLVARLEARRRGELIGVGGAIVVVATYFGWRAWQAVTDPPADAASADRDFVETLAGMSVAYLLLAVGTLVALGYQRRADRRLAGTLRQRVARTTASGARRLLVGGFAVAAIVLYGGGLLVGCTAALVTSHPSDRAAATVFVAGVLGYAALGLAVAANVSRRPAIADDEASLLDDELLRREDVRQALVPYPTMLALVAGVGSHSDRLLLVYVGYALTAAGVWAVASRAATRSTVVDPMTGESTA
jgi:hypothetical protein